MPPTTCGLSPTPASQPLKPWTILLYSAADNDMQAYNLQNIRDLETVGSDAYTNLVAQVDTGAASTRYLIQKAARPSSTDIQSAPLESTGPVNMSDPKTLADFITWGMTQYPAEHTMVIVSDHGGGWEGACEDDSANDWMSMPSMRQAFEQAAQQTGKKVDIIGFDACLMGSTEVAHELKDVCDYVVGSEDYEDSAGWPYTRIFNPELVAHLQQHLLYKTQLSPRALAVECVQDAAGTQDVLPTMTAVDCKQAGVLSDAVRALGDAILAHPETQAIVAHAADAAYPFDEFHDLLDFTRRLQADPKAGGAPNDDIRRAAADVEQAARPVIIAEQHAPIHPDAHGLTLEVSSKGIPEGYADTAFARDTHWTDVLTALHEAVTSPQSPRQTSGLT
jgi:Clostripain family